MTSKDYTAFVTIPANKNSIAHRKLVCGVGVNDADYLVVPELGGKKIICAYYKAWSGMLLRCYDKKFQSNHPTYAGCKVVPEWFSFTVFKNWMETQDWRGKYLDKDIQFPDNKTYGPKACLFVTREINNLFISSKRFKGKYPQGVHLDKPSGKFMACINRYGKRKTLGRFKTPEEASNAYLQAKKSYVLAVACSEPDVRVKQGIYRHAIRLNKNYMARRELNSGSMDT